MTTNVLWDKCFHQLNRQKINMQPNTYINAFEFLLSAKQSGKFVIPRIELVVTTRCTLNCKGCAHLMDYYKERYDVPLDLMITNLSNFLNGIDACVCLGITGGEPFLYPYLDKIIQVCLSNPKILFTNITTNGTIIPDKETIKLFVHSNLYVNISKYDEISKIGEIKSLFDNSSVNYEVLDRGWYEYGGCDFRNKKKAKMMYDFISCHEASYCKTIFIDKLYHCPRAAFMTDLNLIDNDENFLKIDAMSLNNKKIMDFYSKKINEVCNYCDRMEKINIKPGCN